MEQEIEIRQIWEIIKKRWLFLIIFPVLAALISGGVNFYVIKPVYQSSTTLIVGKKAQIAEDNLARQILEANRLLAKTYGEIAKSRKVREQVIAELGLELSADQLNSKISVNQVEDTEILKITVIDTDPELAADVANVMVQKFAAAIIDVENVDSVSVIDKAVAASAPIKPKKMANILIGFTISLIAAFGLSFFMEYMDNTIRNSKEAEQLLGLPVLGVIPEYPVDEDYERREACENID